MHIHRMLYEKHPYFGTLTCVADGAANFPRRSRVSSPIHSWPCRTVGDPQYKTTLGTGGGLSRWATVRGYFSRLNQYATNMILLTNFVEILIFNSEAISSIEARQSFEA